MQSFSYALCTIAVPSVVLPAVSDTEAERAREGNDYWPRCGADKEMPVTLGAAQDYCITAVPPYKYC